MLKVVVGVVTGGDGLGGRGVQWWIWWMIVSKMLAVGSVLADR